MSGHSDFMVHFMNNVEAPTLICALIFGLCKKPMGESIAEIRLLLRPRVMHPGCFLVPSNALALRLYPTHFELGKKFTAKQERKKVQVLSRCFIVVLRGGGGETKEKKELVKCFGFGILQRVSGHNQLKE
jgi:hypothetical protein